MKFENPALIFGAHHIGLWVVRDLGRRGIEIYTVGEDKTCVAFKSKYCKFRVIIPKPWNQQKMKLVLKGIAKKTTKRLVVYALNDIDTLNLSLIKDNLRDDFYFVVGDREATETLVNKLKFYHALEKSKIEFPKTFFPKNLDDVRNLSENISYPVFIRPAITELFIHAFGYRKGFLANSSEELVKYYRLATSRKIKVMLQEVIPGPPANSIQLEGYFKKDYGFIGIFARQRLRIWPPNFGNTTLCTSIAPFQFNVITQKITEFLKSIGYNGLASAELKKDTRDGKYKLLEINARPWLHFWLAARCGIDILFLSYLDAVGKKLNFDSEKKYIVGYKSLDFWSDIPASVNMILKNELTFRDWLSSLYGVKRFTFFAKDDPLPFFSTFYNQLKVALGNAFCQIRQNLV
ncbi:MAG: hypothetical protein QXX41_06705 [Nitrososphaerota archaeon]